MDFRISYVFNNKPLYKIMALRWFREMVEKKCNTLLRPSTWDDPYEMNYSNSVIATQQGDIPLTAQYWFGQSWSLCEESIIMWQAFKRSDEPYVKIKVESNNLIKGLKEENNELRIFVLDYIRYFMPTVDNYQEKVKEVISMHPWQDNFEKRGIGLEELYPVYSLLTKRDIFKHEDEVRLLLFDKSSSDSQESTSYSFDPTTISEVIVDPWTSKDDSKFCKIVEELRLHLPKETTCIRKSEIFSDSSKFSTRYVK